jgi:hypothetical protein
MSAPASVSGPAIVALLSGGGLLVVATALALRALAPARPKPRAAASSFAWMVIAGCSYPILALGAALHVRESGSLRAAAVQLCAVGLAAVLGGLCSTPPEGEGRPSGLLPVAGRGLAWLALVGLAPTVGFPAKVMIYHALLAAGWGGAAVLAMAAGAAGLAPAIWSLRSPRPSALGGLRSALVVVLMGLIVALGLYPQPLVGLAGLLVEIGGLG